MSRPDPDALRTIRRWPIVDRTDAQKLLNYVHGLWGQYADCGWFEQEQDGKVLYRLCTGGRSPAETIVDALEDNDAFWPRAWQATMKGGLYEFRI